MVIIIALLITVIIKLINVIRERNEEINILKLANTSLINMAVEEGLIPKKFKVDSPEVKIKINDYTDK